MPSFSNTLEQAIHAALALANSRSHEFATLEHLLLALIDEPDAARVMRACSVDLGELRSTLVEFVDDDLSNLVTDIDGSEAVPTAAFQRVIQRAAIHVQSSGRTEVTGANVLVAIFAERESDAAYFLQDQDMTRYDAVNFIAHGVAKDPAFGESRPVAGADDEEPAQTIGGGDEPQGDAKESALAKYCIDLNAKSREGDIDPLIGRDQEVERCIQVLCRRRKNNPLLVGDPGVGKTAIAEGLARKIVAGETPEVWGFRTPEEGEVVRNLAPSSQSAAWARMPVGARQEWTVTEGDATRSLVLVSDVDLLGSRGLRVEGTDARLVFENRGSCLFSYGVNGREVALNALYVALLKVPLDGSLAKPGARMQWSDTLDPRALQPGFLSWLRDGLGAFLPLSSPRMEFTAERRGDRLVVEGSGPSLKTRAVVGPDGLTEASMTAGSRTVSLRAAGGWR